MRAFALLQHGGRVSLHSRNRKAGLIAASLLLCLSYSALALCACLAAYYAARPDLASLRAAVRLDPWSAEYQHQLGRYYSLVLHNFEAGLSACKTATQLDPHGAQYWLSMAAAFNFLGDSSAQKQALERALELDPRTPEVAWQAANFYLVRGDTDAALREFRVVLQNDPYLPPAALQLCWRVRPDVDTLLRDVVPPSAPAYLAFLDLLIAKQETAAAARVWERLLGLQQPIEPRHLFDYLHYLIQQRQVEQARLAWQQAAPLTGLSAYLPSSDNLMVNGDFSLDVLNGGFDWLYRKQPGVALALDPADFHVGHRSLSIVFDGPGVEDAGIQQLVPVQPATSYDFSAYFKAKDMQGAGGPRLLLQDFYKATDCFASEELKDADYWRPVSGTFTTGPETTLLVLRVQRFPVGSPIRGQLWIDDLRLTPRQP